MQINFYSSLRNITGRSSIIYAADVDLALLEVLNLLAQEFPAFRVLFFDKDGAVAAQMPIFLNGQNPRLLPEGLNTKVSATDVLSLFTPISSGKINVEVLRQADLEETITELENED